MAYSMLMTTSARAVIASAAALLGLALVAAIVAMHTPAPMPSPMTMSTVTASTSTPTHTFETRTARGSAQPEATHHTDRDDGACCWPDTDMAAADHCAAVVPTQTASAQPATAALLTCWALHPRMTETSISDRAQPHHDAGVSLTALCVQRT